MSSLNERSEAGRGVNSRETQTEGASCFSEISACCVEQQQCCATLEEKLKASAVDCSAEISLLRSCCERIMQCCQAGAAHFGASLDSPQFARQS